MNNNNYITTVGPLFQLPDLSSPSLPFASYQTTNSNNIILNISKNSALSLAQNWNLGLPKLVRYLLPNPILLNHKPSPSPLGQILDIIPEDSSINILVKWINKPSPTEPIFLQPRWKLREAQPGIYEPSHLISIGLFYQSHIPPHNLPQTTKAILNTKSTLQLLNHHGLAFRANNRYKLVQHHMINSGASYTEAWRHIKKNFPELF